jgi:rhodanese-related sulfurtransferase
MKRIAQILIILLVSNSFAQKSVSELLDKFNSHSIPYISVQELAMPKTKAIILDTREEKEYEVSRIKNAWFVGYENFKIETILDQIKDKNEQIVVYCSLGIRSEDIAEKIKKAGYSNVYNLHGGIFEWKNNNYPLYSSDMKQTDDVHVFSKEWSQWLKKGNKVY